MFMAKHIGSIRRGIPPGLGIIDGEDQGNTVGLWLRHLRNLVIDAPGLVGFAPRFAYRRFLKRRRIPSVVLPTKQPIYPMHYGRTVAQPRFTGHAGGRARPVWPAAGAAELPSA